MACGRPVVLTRTRGLWDRSLLDGCNVLLVAPSQPRALAERISELLDDQARADEVGTAARQHVVATAAIEGFAERLARVCRGAVERGGAQSTQ
jgi:glycosyltransferase involved in cell wall biosynthesis